MQAEGVDAEAEVSCHSKGTTKSADRGDEDETARDSVIFLQSFLDKKNLEKNPTFLILTISENGEQNYATMTLRDVLKLVQDEVAPLCAASHSSQHDAIAVSDVKYRDIRRMESILFAHEEPAILVCSFLYP